MSAVRSLLSVAMPLLLASCSFLAEPSIDALAERVPVYDDSTPVNSYRLPHIKTIGELRAALAGGLNPNGSDGRNWYLGSGSSYDAEQRYSAEELATQRLAFLDVMLRAGADPQKAAPQGNREEYSITYALLIRHGLRADEPFTPSPSDAAEGNYESERYPHHGLWRLPQNIVEWLVENGAPINERFNGKTLLMNLYDSLWTAVLLESMPYMQELFERTGRDRETDAAWERAHRLTEYLLAQGADLSVCDEHGKYAIDYIPLAGAGADGRSACSTDYSEELYARAEALKQLLLAHGSRARTAPGNWGESAAKMGWGLMTVLWDADEQDALAEERRRRTDAEHEAREARLAPLRAARRAAAEKRSEGQPAPQHPAN